MHEISLDIETYSSVDLTKCGVFKYAESPDFEILLCSVLFPWDKEPRCYDLTNREEESLFLTEFQDILMNPNFIKTAYNANFEITCLSKYFGMWLDPTNWEDTMIAAATLGLPRKLGDVGKALCLPQDKQKDKRGKALIDYFSKPCKPTKSNGGRTRNLPRDAPEMWAEYKEYNRQDVVAEKAIRDRLRQYIPGKSEHDAWVLDQRINRYGVQIDRKLYTMAIKIANEHTALLKSEATNLGIQNPNSVSQLKSALGVEGTLNKKDVAAMLQEDLPDDQRRLLEIRTELGKSSVSKYQAMERYTCSDGRARGLFQFYGANRTGRWAGRGIQLQNLPQNHIPDLKAARDCVLTGDRELVEMMYGNVPDTLSQLIRTALIPGDGQRFAVADFSAIEARVIAWLAGEKWRQDVFKNGGDIYCASASQMFHVPVVKHGVNGHLRQRGKVAELALGYGGGVGALTAMGGADLGLTDEEMEEIKVKWREASPNIVKLWWSVDKAVTTILKGEKDVVKLKDLLFIRTPALMHIRLPSGRSLRYYKPKLVEGKYGREVVEYQAYDEGKWGKAESYGPKFVENIVQAIARDCLLISMTRVDKLGYRIVGHVHDEMIVEVKSETAEEDLQTICGCMNAPIPWAPGLLLRGDGYLCDFYRKD